MEILVIIALVILAGAMIFMANRKPEGSSSTILPILDARLQVLLRKLLPKQKLQSRK
jgi:hypothetical protein